ncbi:MAG: ICEBs1 excisionase [Clostridia bacterium]|nr:ICEBs1 excisionase [Clostridia bacterium]
MSNPYITTGELAELIGASKSTASRIISDVNKNLRKDGFYTFRGKAPRNAVLKRLGLAEQKGATI